MPAVTEMSLVEVVRGAARPMTGAASDYDDLLELIGEARFVLLGEASHGTHEFYRARADITKRLIREKGFAAMAVEADWPDAYRVNRYIRGASEDEETIDALGDFKRFPTWMWRNADVLDFVGWLREYNDGLPPDVPKFGFYGLDLYSLNASMGAVLDYLDHVDPEAAKRARHRYSCFEDFNENAQAYGFAARFDLNRSCEKEVVSQLVELRRRAADYARRDGGIAAEEFFYAEQNARLVKNAEEYYRSMFQGQIESWNLRDRHMVETLNAVVSHLAGQVARPKLVVWAHNSHLGDARATQMSQRGEWNVGQLTREQVGRDAVLVGFTTYRGSVTAASDWDEPAERKQVRAALRGSYELLFHDSGIPRFFIPLRDHHEAHDRLRDPHLERAIGVVYRPDTERLSHYFHASLSGQFDAVLHFDETRAVEPLEATAQWQTEEPADDTYPFGV